MYDEDRYYLEDVIGFLATAIGIAAAILWCYYWAVLGPNPNTDAARKIWRNSTGTVKKVSEVKGDSPQTAFRMAKLSFPDFNGRPKTKEVPMKYTVEPGDKKLAVVGKRGSVWIESDLDRSGTNPLEPSNTLGLIMTVSIIVPILIGVIIGFASWVIMLSLIRAINLAASWIYRLFTRPALSRLAYIKVKRFMRSLMDETKLRWEFTRRRRRIRLSPAYKQVRRFQAELARMDPTPSVISARRRANELLTKVLDRDNERLEVIDGLIDVIRQDTELDLEARKLAHEELAENY